MITYNVRRTPSPQRIPIWPKIFTSFFENINGYSICLKQFRPTSFFLNKKVLYTCAFFPNLELVRVRVRVWIRVRVWVRVRVRVENSSCDLGSEPRLQDELLEFLKIPVYATRYSLSLLLCMTFSCYSDNIIILFFHDKVIMLSW
jgi:hypothetical protein